MSFFGPFEFAGYTDYRSAFSREERRFFLSGEESNRRAGSPARRNCEGRGNMAGSFLKMGLPILCCLPLLCRWPDKPKRTCDRSWRGHPPPSDGMQCACNEYTHTRSDRGHLGYNAPATNTHTHPDRQGRIWDALRLQAMHTLTHRCQPSKSRPVVFAAGFLFSLGAWPCRLLSFQSSG